MEDDSAFLSCNRSNVLEDLANVSCEFDLLAGVRSLADTVSEIGGAEVFLSLKIEADLIKELIGLLCLLTVAVVFSSRMLSPRVTLAGNFTGFPLVGSGIDTGGKLEIPFVPLACRSIFGVEGREWLAEGVGAKLKCKSEDTRPFPSCLKMLFLNSTSNSESSPSCCSVMANLEMAIFECRNDLTDKPLLSLLTTSPRAESGLYFGGGLCLKLFSRVGRTVAEDVRRMLGELREGDGDRGLIEGASCNELAERGIVLGSESLWFE